MDNKELETFLAKCPNVDFVSVDGDGYHHQLTIVSDRFIGKTTVARQQWVYAQIKAFITTGSLHAINMKTLTKKEWDEHHG